MKLKEHEELVEAIRTGTEALEDIADSLSVVAEVFEKVLELHDKEELDN